MPEWRGRLAKMESVRITFIGAGKRALRMCSRIVAALPESVAPVGVRSGPGESSLEAGERGLRLLTGTSPAPGFVS